MPATCCWASLAHSEFGVRALLYYVITYALATIGAFGVLAALEEEGVDQITDFAGLSRRAPALSFCMLIFLLSLAGIPPLAGFFGKFYIFSAALAAGEGHLGLLWLVILAIAMSTVSLYYYLKVLKQIYVLDPVGRRGSPAHGVDQKRHAVCDRGIGDCLGLRAESSAGAARERAALDHAIGRANDRRVTWAAAGSTFSTPLHPDRRSQEESAVVRLLAAVFGTRSGLREVRIRIFDHFILIAVAQLAREMGVVRLIGEGESPLRPLCLHHYRNSAAWTCCSEMRISAVVLPQNKEGGGAAASLHPLAGYKAMVTALSSV